MDIVKKVDWRFWIRGMCILDPILGKNWVYREVDGGCIRSWC